MESKRVEWIDIYKAVAIILVVLGHTSGVFTKYIYIFHVPIFFLIVGYTEKFENKSFTEILVSKFCSLMIPFYFINITVVIVRCYLGIFSLESIFYSDSITLNNITTYINSILKISWTTDIGGASWFLPALFIGILIAKTLLLLEKKATIYVPLIMSFVGFVFVHILWKYSIYMPYKIDLGLLVSFYIILGRMFKKNKVENIVKLNNNWMILTFMLIYLAIFSNVLNADIDIANSKLNKTIIDLFSVIFGYILMINICEVCKSLKIKEQLLYLGKNTLPLMLLHFGILKCIFILEYYLGITKIETLKNLTPEINKYSCILYTITIVFIFIRFNKKMETKKLYQIFVMGKLKLKLKTNKIFDYAIGSIILIFVITNLPLQNIREIRSIGNNLETAQIITGVFDDGFLGKEAEIRIATKNEGTLQIEFYIPDNGIENSVQIFSSDKEVGSFNLNKGINDILINLEKNKIIELKFVFKNTFIPSLMSKTLDDRELSAVLSHMEAR